MSRRGARLYHTRGNRDRNERDIIDTLEARGFSVCQIQGRGVPDLLVAKQEWDVRLGEMVRRIWLVEIKQPKKGYTAAQVEWRAKWTGPPSFCLRTVDEAMAFPVAYQEQAGT